MNNENTNNEVSRLPLWRACLDEMLASGIKYNDTFPASYFEARLKCGADTMEFSIGISDIRRGLEHHGMYLSGRGQNGEQFVVLPPEKNADMMTDYARKAVDALKRGVILGTNTPLSTLGDEGRARHERLLEKMQLRAVLLQRPAAVLKAISTRRRTRLGLGG